MKDEDFEYFKVLVFDLCGITVNEKKRDLLLTRLSSHLKNSTFETYSDYRRYLQGLNHDHPEWQAIINIMTTNKTDFFREMRHFDYIEEVLIPYWVKNKKTEVLIWSAACSTGEEPYSLAMFMEEKLPKDISYKIIASDIDTNVISKAKNAVYSISKENEIPDSFQKYIQRGKGNIEAWFRIKSQVKSKIEFRQFNLIEDQMPESIKFDLILCRNVMIYFSREIVEKVAINLSRSCHNDGELFIGHSESLQGTKTPWSVLTPSIYGKR